MERLSKRVFFSFSSALLLIGIDEDFKKVFEEFYSQLSPSTKRLFHLATLFLEFITIFIKWRRFSSLSLEMRTKVLEKFSSSKIFSFRGIVYFLKGLASSIYALRFEFDKECLKKLYINR